MMAVVLVLFLIGLAVAWAFLIGLAKAMIHEEQKENQNAR